MFIMCPFPTPLFIFSSTRCPSEKAKVLAMWLTQVGSCRPWQRHFESSILINSSRLTRSHRHGENDDGVVKQCHQEIVTPNVFFFTFSESFWSAHSAASDGLLFGSGWRPYLQDQIWWLSTSFSHDPWKDHRTINPF